MTEQPSLFESTPPPPRPRSRARAEFIAGMLGQWFYGDRKPPKAARDGLALLADRLVNDAQMIRDLHP